MMNLRYWSKCFVPLTTSASLALFLVPNAFGATLCVDPANAGCFATIGAALASSSGRDTIQVAPGTYHEDVEITKAVTLTGAGMDLTVIDATGLPNGIFVNGLHGGVSRITITGFTVQNANYEGILVVNASDVTVSHNHVTNNDRALDVVNFTCPGLPDFETSEAFDCGEAIHLSGVSASRFADNLVNHNAGGFLVSDETGPTHNNVIARNTVHDNIYDCGITVPSHPPAPGTGRRTPFGVWGNVFDSNDVAGNGVAGGGAGIGFFAFLPGARVSDNLAMNNRITGNGLPGIAFHAHGGNENLNNNMLIGNTISGNGKDDEDAATPGPTGINIFGRSPITGTVISNNQIDNEAIDIAIHTPGAVEAHSNNLLGSGFGVENLGSGLVDASRNWWGCAAGPNAPGCSQVGPNVIYIPWLTAPAETGFPRGQR